MKIEQDLIDMENKTYIRWWKEYLRDIRELDERCDFEQAVLDYEKLIYKQVNVYIPQIQNNVEYGDLMQEALIILKNSLRDYRPVISGISIKFSTYLTYQLKGYLQAEFNKKFRGIKLTQTAFQNNKAKYVDMNTADDTRDFLIETGLCVDFYCLDMDLKDAINQLKDYERGIIVLHFFKGYNIVDLANKLCRSKQSMSRTIKTLVKKLKKIMGVD
jgi:RNA polymerase sigma factor (sigma-70 family)